MTGNEIIKRFDGMNDYANGNWMNLWQECADWAMPTNDNVNQIRTAGQEKPTQRMIDTCIEANFNFASGFFSHMFPPNTIWAKFRHPMPEMMSKQPVADYFEEVSRIVHSVMTGSNFAQEEFQALLAMGCFGTSCMSVEESDKNVVTFRNFIVSKVRIAENYQGDVDTVAREFELDPRQAVQQFGEEALKKVDLEKIVIDAKNVKNTKYQFVHYVCPREDFDTKKMDKLNKPYASFYVSRDGMQIVKEGGFDYLPYKVARFVVGNDEVYGRSPMTMKLGAARRTNVIYRSVVLSAEQHTNSQWLVPDDDSVKGLSSRAGAVIRWRATNPNGRPERLPPNGDPGIGKDMLEMHDAEIKRMFFNHLFRPLEDYRNMTATEVNERMTSDLMTLAPFVSRYTDEKVTPTMEQVYYLCAKRGILPPMPAELSDHPDFEIDYVGRLALATKNFEVLGAVQTMRIMAELTQSTPQLAPWADNIGVDELTHEMWFANSASMNALKDPAVRDEERDVRAQAAEKQQQIENMPPVADAALKASQIEQTGE
jgi:hypothetical protein